MTREDRVESLKKFGYTEREAAFLCTAALHSGYFLRRQFLYFTGKCRGQIAANLIDRTTELGHAKARAFRSDRIVYHLASKPLYAALGQTDNRHRREHQTSTIKSRLMSLDFVLQHPNVRFIETESERLSFFFDELKLNRECLPVARYRSAESQAITERYFVDKFPIYASNNEDGGSPIVHFCYIDEGLHSTSGFERYLDQYAQLFTQLAAFRVIYVSCFGDQFERAARLFANRIHAGKCAPADPQIEALLAHFRDRTAFERRDFSGVTQSRLISYREASQMFSGDRYERLFERWKADGDASVTALLNPATTTVSNQKAGFSTYRLAFQYELFGNLTNGDWKGKVTWR